MNNHKKTKVLYIITLLSWGGAQKYVYDLAHGLGNGADWEPIISGGDQAKGELAEKAKSCGLKLITIKNLVREVSPLKDLMAVWEIKKLIEIQKPDVVHLNSSKAGVVGSIAARISKHRAKIIFTCHGWVFNENLNPLVKFIYLAMEILTGRFNDKIICLSGLDKKTALAKKITTADKLLVIYNGIEEKNNFLEKEPARKALGLPPAGIVVGTIGNFFANKGLEYFIEAIEILLSEYKLGATALIIGDGEQRQKLEKLITEKHLEKNIILAGTKKDASQYLKAFDIYLSSSVKEGVPYSIIEAMRAGLPVVATRVGGIPEIINDGQDGLLTETKNPAALAEKIKILLDDKALAENLARQATKKIQTAFNKEKMVAATLAVYKS
jgi:glycosyltransferase involved in cell wall biosynthesis